MSENGEFKSAYDRRGYVSMLKSLGAETVLAVNDETVTDIMLNCDGRLFVERAGSGMVEAGRIEAKRAEAAIRMMATLSGHELDLERPILSVEIPYNGSRFEGLLPPLVPAPVFSIRRHNAMSVGLEELREGGMLTEGEVEMFRRALRRHCSILIAGATGTGKTTLLNSLLNETADLCAKERIVTVEDTPELKVKSGNRLHLYTSEHTGMSRLVKSALRLRPDRIIVGEVRGAEALDMIDALCTGHRGGFASIHAGSVMQALRRLTLLVSRNGEAPRRIEEQAAQAIDLVAVLTRDRGRRLKEAAVCTGFAAGAFRLRLARTARELDAALDVKEEEAGSDLEEFKPEGCAKSGGIA